MCNCERLFPTLPYNRNAHWSSKKSTVKTITLYSAWRIFFDILKHFIYVTSWTVINYTTSMTLINWECVCWTNWSTSVTSCCAPLSVLCISDTNFYLHNKFVSKTLSLHFYFPYTLLESCRFHGTSDCNLSIEFGKLSIDNEKIV